MPEGTHKPILSLWEIDWDKPRGVSKESGSLQYLLNWIYSKGWDP